MSNSKPLATVELGIPSRPEFVGVARLAILGVASRMRFSYDEVEDIRLAVGEACTRSIERLNGSPAEGQPIQIRCLIETNRLTIETRSPLVEAPARRAPEEDEAAAAVDNADLSGVLIRILMDEVESQEVPDERAYVIRMVKYVAR